MNSIKSNKPYRKGVNAIIVDKDNNFLLVQKKGYKDSEWNFLGGGRKEGETLNQNMFRELKEEIGSEETDLEIVGVSTHKIEYDYPPDTVLKIHSGRYRGQSYDQVILRYIEDKNKLEFTTEEFKKHKWVKAKELKKYLVFPNQYENHKKAIDELLPGLIK
jgi:putative (di)nucleoside polyphosphate hydrolase